MNKFEFEITEEQDLIRLDKYLSGKLVDISRSKLKELIIQGNVSVNGVVVKDPSFKLKLNCIISVQFEFIRDNSLVPKNIPLNIVYEDDDLIVLNKQAGLTVHPGAGNHNDTLVNALVHHCAGNLSNIAGEARPGIVHRLDRDTSGLMVVAKNNFAHSKLSEDLANREIKRKYVALIYKTIIPKLGKISTGYAKSKNDPTRMVVTRSKENLAITNYRIIDSFFQDSFSLIEFVLETGRTHQIRFHMEHMGTKIFGDKVYGKSFNFNTVGIPKTIHDEIKKIDRQLLHSYKLEFEHPRTGEWLSFEAEYPEEISKILDISSDELFD